MIEHSSRLGRIFKSATLLVLLGSLFGAANGCVSSSGDTDGSAVGSDPGTDPVAYGFADQLVAKASPELLANPDHLDEFLDGLDARVAHVDRTTDTLWIRRTPESATPLPELKRVVEGLEGISRVSFDPLMHGTGWGNGGHKIWSCIQSMMQPEGPSAWHLAALRMANVWNGQPTADGIVVAVLDTGVALDGYGACPVPGLESTVMLPGQDLVNLDDDPNDDNGHGTLLTSILAADGVFPGVAPGVSVLPVKVLDADRMGSESALAAGINLAVASGAQVISMSLAFPQGFVPSGDLATAVHDASMAGVLLVAATGNHGAGEVSYPAAFGEVMAVGGVRLTQKIKRITPECAEVWPYYPVAHKTGRADYSAWGAGVDLCAPGGSMQHDLDGDGYPDAIPAMGFDPLTPAVYEGFLMAGTSPATVEAAGMSALLLAAGAEPADVRPLLQANATNVGPAGFHTACGMGLADGRMTFKRLAQDKIPERVARYANPVLTLAEDTLGNRRAVAFVEIVDEDNNPVPDATVVGHFRGAIVHDVSAITDDQGRVLMTSLAAPPTATMFEFTVDKVIDGKEVITPKGFSRFERSSFGVLSSVRAEGAGTEPSPFNIFIDPDALAPLLADFGQDMITGADPALPVFDPVTTIPTDVTSWTLVQSLTSRTFGSSVAPVTMVIDRQILIDDCEISEDILPIFSLGSGTEPSPFRLDESLISSQITFEEVLVRSDQLFLDGQPTTETALGLYFGTQGTVIIDVAGSVCEPPSVVFGNIDVLSDAVLNGDPVNDGGLTIVVDDQAPPPPPASGTISFEEQSALGAAYGQQPFSTGNGMDAEAAVDGSPGTGIIPMP